MKTTYNYLILALLLSWFGLRSQTSPLACAQATSTGTTSLPCLTDPSLYDPSTTRRDTVYVNIYLSKPTNTAVAGEFDTITRASAQHLVTLINYLVTNSLTPPQLTVSGVPFIAFPRLYVKLVNFEHVANDSAYFYAPAWQNINPTDTILNIIWGTNASYNGYGISHGIPGNEVYVVDAQAPGYTALYVPWAGGGSEAMLLFHEICHALGLYHTQDDATDNYDYSLVNVDDYYKEPSTIWGVSASPGAPNTSNNVMSYNWDTRQYLSPKQIGLIQYYLQSGTTAHYTSLCHYDTTQTVRVTSTQTWTLAKFISGDLIVKSGNTLTVKCKVSMSRGKVTVENGAALIIDGGEITQGCNRSWQGIEVAGTSTVAPAYNATTGLSPNQGVLKIINGGTVSHAGIAVRNYTAFPTGSIDWNSTGGLIFANDAIFENNGRDVEFQSYPNFQSTSYFYNCKFLLNDSIGGGQQPDHRVTMWENTGIKFKGCTFSYDNTSGAYPSTMSPGSGILTQDASYTVDKICSGIYPYTCVGTSSFSNFYYGVQVVNANPLFAVNISNTNFTHCWMDAANYQNMSSFIFESNTVENKQLFTGGGNGVYLNTCQNYTIKNNTIFETGTSRATTGIYAFQSGAGSHQIYRNNIYQVHAGINAVGDNNGGSASAGLLMNCNNFTANHNYYDVTMQSALLQSYSSYTIVPPTVMARQGYSLSASPSGTTEVRNKYAAPCGSNNKWYVDSWGTQVIAHASFTDASTQPLPHTGSACSPTLINVSVVPVVFNYTADCPSGLPTGFIAGTSSLTLANANSYIQNAIAAGGTDQFGLQAAMATKLNLFVSDSVLANPDSVISTLDQNVGSMANADILTVFAYLRKHDYTSATTKANALAAGRADWKALFLELITIYQSTDKIYSIKTNPDYKTFLMGYATTDGKDGQYVAQSLIEFVCDTDFVNQRPLPDGGGGREMAPDNKSVSSSEIINIYPNPTQNGVNVDCMGYGGSTLLLEVRDLLGRTILTKFISGLDQQYVPMSEFKSGVYFFSVSKDREIVYSTKIVKED